MTASHSKNATLTTDNLDDPVVNYVRKDFVALRHGLTVGEALQQLRRQELSEKILYLYTVDEDNVLVGVLPTRTLLLADLDVKLSNIMLSRVIKIPHTATVMVACECFLLHRLLAFPVVDAEDRIIGVVDVNLFTDEVLNMAERRSADDIFQLIGVRVAQAKRLSPLQNFRRRFPWLLANITGGIVCAILSGFYEGLLDAVVVLALFIPIVLALAESVSMQSMTLTLQRLHGEGANRRSFFVALGREFLTAILLGIAAGGVVGLVTFAWRGELTVSVVVGASIGLSMITACLLGVALPTALRAFKVDPRVAAGPMVLSATDILTLLFYFNLAGIILGALH
ncbi:MAG: magnesium transporter [Candidatus Hydrogenedentota bacterium]